MQQSGPPLPKICVSEGVFLNETPEMTTFWGGAQFSGGGGLKRPQLKGSHVSTCWNPKNWAKMSFSLRYGVTFRGLRFGHHVSERNVSTFHVSAAAKGGSRHGRGGSETFWKPLTPWYFLRWEEKSQSSIDGFGVLQDGSAERFT